MYESSHLDVSNRSLSAKKCIRTRPIMIVTTITGSFRALLVLSHDFSVDLDSFGKRRTARQ